jgi:transcriptional regulator with XRE-family HTH domain
MPGFATNLKRAREAAGLRVGELAARTSLSAAAIVELERPDAPLPELPLLVRLADALACVVDDLLAGADEDFDRPQRRHAALIAARMGRLRVLMTQVRVAHDRGEVRPQDRTTLDEASVLECVGRCRAWIMSGDHDLDVAAAIESELDLHVGRVRAVYQRLRRHADAVAGIRLAAPVAPAPKPTGDALGGTVANTLAQAPAGAAPAAPPPATVAMAGTLRIPGGHYSTLWAQECTDQQHRCELVTKGREVHVQLFLDNAVVESRHCQTLDEAFRQSSEWRGTYLAPAILALPPVPSCEDGAPRAPSVPDRAA